jgi:hypothetical protein
MEVLHLASPHRALLYPSPSPRALPPLGRRCHAASAQTTVSCTPEPRWASHIPEQPPPREVTDESKADAKLLPPSGTLLRGLPRLAAVRPRLCQQASPKSHVAP